MAGQLSAVGAQSLANKIGGIIPPFIGTSAPTWVPGLDWINTTAGAVLYQWNSAAWVTAASLGNYIALLTGDPTTSGAGGTYAYSVSDLVEDTTSGYARQSVTFAEPPVYSGATTYVLGQTVFYQNSLYQCAVSSTIGNAPTGTNTSNTQWTYVSNGYPAQVANTNLLTWTYTAAQALPVQWAALVTCQTGTLGLLKYMWALPAPQQVANSQSIQVGIGALTLGQS